MLTPRENYLELVKGGKPDRLVNGYEPFAFIFSDPLLKKILFRLLCRRPGHAESLQRNHPLGEGRACRNAVYYTGK